MLILFLVTYNKIKISAQNIIGRLLEMLKSSNKHVIGNSVLALLKLALNG